MLNKKLIANNKEAKVYVSRRILRKYPDRVLINIENNGEKSIDFAEILFKR